MKHSSKLLVKSITGTVISAIVFLLLYQALGYDRAELLAFAVLVGLSIAALK